MALSFFISLFVTYTDIANRQTTNIFFGFLGIHSSDAREKKKEKKEGKKRKKEKKKIHCIAFREDSPWCGSFRAARSEV